MNRSVGPLVLRHHHHHHHHSFVRGYDGEAIDIDRDAARDANDDDDDDDDAGTAMCV